MELDLNIADIATDEKKLLRGFRVLGVFPFYLRYIKTGTHIQLCKIKKQIQLLKKGEPVISDFDDPKLQNDILPLINKFIVVALVNNRSFGWFFTWALNRKLKACGHYHILQLYLNIFKLDDPTFFLSYWRLILLKDNTILKEAEPS